MPEDIKLVLTEVQARQLAAQIGATGQRLDDVRRIERAVLGTLAGREGRQWQSIETAPRDGRTLLLGYFNSLGNWRTVRGQWMSEDYIAEYWEDPDDVEPGWFETSAESDDLPNCWRVDPGYWQPLPAPPVGAQRAKGGA